MLLWVSHNLLCSYSISLPVPIFSLLFYELVLFVVSLSLMSNHLPGLNSSLLLYYFPNQLDRFGFTTFCKRSLKYMKSINLKGVAKKTKTKLNNTLKLGKKY